MGYVILTENSPLFAIALKQFSERFCTDSWLRGPTRNTTVNILLSSVLKGLVQSYLYTVMCICTYFSENKF